MHRTRLTVDVKLAVIKTPLLGTRLLLRLHGYTGTERRMME